VGFVNFNCFSVNEMHVKLFVDRTLYHRVQTVTWSFSHGMSYPISGNVGTYIADGYEKDLPLIVSGTIVFFYQYSKCFSKSYIILEYLKKVKDNSNNLFCFCCLKYKSSVFYANYFNGELLQIFEKKYLGVIFILNTPSS